MSSLISTNPSKNYAPIGEVQVSTEEEIKSKVVQAHKAKKEWNEIGLHKRIELLREVYDAFQARKDEITHIATEEMGFPTQQQIDFDLGDGFNYFNWYLENAAKYISPEITFESDTQIHTVYYEPVGVAAVIQPWNFPFCQWSWAVVPNLIAGNTVVFKHSEECPLSGKLIEEIVNSCNLAKGVFSEVYGGADVGEILLDQDINLISFTGSVKTGKKVYEIAGKKFIKALIELGGSAPCIVFDDVNIDEVAELIYAQRFSNNGQCCDGLKRLIVQESIFDSMIKKLKEIVESKKIGDAEDANTDIGPLSAKRQLELLVSQVDDAVKKGATVITGGKKPKGLEGAYYEPTILTNISKDMRVWYEEVFGPVLPVIAFQNEDQAIRMANDTPFGLGSYIYSQDIKRAKRVAMQIDTGMVSINGTNYVCPFNPFGGYKASGIGREHGHFGLQEVTQVKVIAENK